MLPIHINIPGITASFPSIYLGGSHLLFTIPVCIYYALLDPVVAVSLRNLPIFELLIVYNWFSKGLLLAIFSGFGFHGQHLIATHSTSYIWNLGLMLQLAGWGAQIVVGHGIFESESTYMCCSMTVLM